MSFALGYTQKQSENFSRLRGVAFWAATLGVIQAAIWILLTTLGLLHYNCLIPIDNKVTYGSIVKFVFFELYFHGNCEPDVYASVNYDVLNTVETILSPQAILIWTSIYLGVMVFWLLSSIMVIKYLETNDVSVICLNVYVWIGVTLAICIQDLVLGIFFAIDYGRFNTQAYDYNLATYEAGAIVPDAVQLIAGQVSAISMMIISFKGFILWIWNCALMIYLLVQVLTVSGVISDDENLLPDRNDCEDIQNDSPINAYNDQSKKVAAYSNDGFVPETRSIVAGTVELNQDPIARAARIAMDACLQDRRFRNIEGYKQYPPPVELPAPISPQNNGQLRTTRY